MLTELLDAIGFGLCHQLPERSFIAGGLQVPVCARDTGIYLGFVFALIALALHRRERPRGLPVWWGWLLAGLLVAWMGWDGVTSYAGMRDTSNLLRLVTGTGAGGSAGMLVAAMLNDVVWSRSSERRILERPADGLVWMGALIAVGAFALWVGPHLGGLYPVLVAAAILVTFTSVNLVIVGMLPTFDRRAVHLADLALPGVIAFALTLLEITGSGLLKAFLLSIA